MAKDYTIDASRDYELDLTIVEEDGTTPLNLTGALVRWAMRGQYSVSDTPLVVKSSADAAQIIVTDAAAGEATVFIDPADTVALGGRICRYEVDVTDVVGNESTVLVGLVTVNRSILT